MRHDLGRLARLDFELTSGRNQDKGGLGEKEKDGAGSLGLGRAALRQVAQVLIFVWCAKCCTACVYIKHCGRYNSPFY